MMIRQGYGVLDREWERKLGWYFGPGQATALRSSHGAMTRRLEAKAYKTDSPEIRHSRALFRADLKAAKKRGRDRHAMPKEPLITAAPTAEKPPAPSVKEFERRTKHENTVAEVSGGLRRLARVCPEGPTVLELLYDDGAEDWISMGFRFGPLYRRDERAVRLLAGLHRAHSGRINKQREKALRRKQVYTPPPTPTDLELFVADIGAASQVEDVDRLKEYAAIESEARSLATRVASTWLDLHRGEA